MKMQNMVRFPLMGMDMAPHVVKRSQSSWSLPSHWSPWRRPYGLGRNPDDFLYDLYAVCNHHGNMHGGHYTGKGRVCWSDLLGYKVQLLLSSRYAGILSVDPVRRHFGVDGGAKHFTH